MINLIKKLYSPECENGVVEVENHKSFDYENAEVILDVKHLKQFFRFGRGAFKYNKAVHDVSFKVYKGEVFGLVGESGCGKTTTGRSIIKLYQITSGDVWFKNHRIAAGTRWNKKEIKYTKIRLKNSLKAMQENKENEIEELKRQYFDQYSEEFNYDKIRKLETDELNKKSFLKPYDDIVNKFDAMRSNAINDANQIIETQRAKIKQAIHDNDHCDHDMAKHEVEKVNAQYAEFLASIKGKKKDFLPEAEREKLEQYYKDLEEAKRASITSKIQMIFQDPIASLNPRMTVRDIISEGLVIRGIKDKEFIAKEVNRVLELVGLVPEHANRYPHEFSGGQRQRIGIARAIIMNPELIIADEPVSALDVSIQAQVINLLNDLRNDLGLTILFIAHNLSVVKYFCDRIAVMYYGKLVELATSEELFKNPLHPYTKSLLSAVPHPDPNIERNRVRQSYDASSAHDYSVHKPSIREIVPGHFVYCNDIEAEQYLAELNK